MSFQSGKDSPASQKVVQPPLARVRSVPIAVTTVSACRGPRVDYCSMRSTWWTESSWRSWKPLLVMLWCLQLQKRPPPPHCRRRPGSGNSFCSSFPRPQSSLCTFFTTCHYLVVALNCCLWSGVNNCSLYSPFSHGWSDDSPCTCQQ